MTHTFEIFPALGSQWRWRFAVGRYVLCESSRSYETEEQCREAAQTVCDCAHLGQIVRIGESAAPALTTPAGRLLDLAELTNEVSALRAVVERHIGQPWPVAHPSDSTPPARDPQQQRAAG